MMISSQPYSFLPQIERKEKEDQLNGVLTDYQAKIEEMTRQLSDYAAKTTKCEDQKATIQVNLEKLESEKADCLNSHDNVNREKVCNGSKLMGSSVVKLTKYCICSNRSYTPSSSHP